MIPVTNNKEKPTLGSSKSWPTDHPLHYRTTKSHFKSLHYLQQQQSLVTLVLTLGTYLYTRFQVFRAGNPPYSILWALWEENLTSSDSEPHSEDIVQIGVILKKTHVFYFPGWVLWLPTRRHHYLWHESPILLMPIYLVPLSVPFSPRIWHFSHTFTLTFTTFCMA